MSGKIGEIGEIRRKPALTDSLIDYLKEVQGESKDPQDVKQLGGTLLERAESIYTQTKGICTLAHNVYENPTRFGCSTVVLATGIANIYSGNPIAGGMEVLLGAKELYNQCGGGDNSTLQRLLDDINADVDMVRTLEEGQQQSYNVIDGNLGLIRVEVDALHKRLDEIKELNLEAAQSIESSKIQAYEKGLEAREAFRAALSLFDETKKSFGTSKQVYEKCTKQFQHIRQIATQQGEEMSIFQRMDFLVGVAKKATETCAEGKRHLDNADEKYNEAMTALAGAMKLKDAAIEIISKTAQSAEDALKAGIEKTEYTTECTKTIEATQKELKEVKERSDDIMTLLDEMSEDIQKAKTEAGKKLDPTDVFVGVGAGVVFAPFGTVSALAVGFTTAYACHNGTAIAETAKKAYNYLFGKPQLPPEPVSTQEVLRVKLQETSTGLYGRLKGRPSYTAGAVDINLGGNEVLKLDFDLNNRQYPISKENLFNLYNRMFLKLKEGKLEPEHCKAIINKLKTEVIPRGGLNPDVKGLISDKQAANGLVKAILKFCN